jgi:hypothetical protein
METTKRQFALRDKAVHENKTYLGMELGIVGVVAIRDNIALAGNGQVSFELCSRNSKWILATILSKRVQNVKSI